MEPESSSTSRMLGLMSTVEPTVNVGSGTVERSVCGNAEKGSRAPAATASAKAPPRRAFTDGAWAPWRLQGDVRLDIALRPPRARDADRDSVIDLCVAGDQAGLAAGILVAAATAAAACLGGRREAGRRRAGVLALPVHHIEHLVAELVGA